jgi:hypothetical protein
VIKVCLVKFKKKNKKFKKILNENFFPKIKNSIQAYKILSSNDNKKNNNLLYFYYLSFK